MKILHKKIRGAAKILGRTLFMHLLIIKCQRWKTLELLYFRLGSLETTQNRHLIVIWYRPVKINNRIFVCTNTVCKFYEKNQNLIVSNRIVFHCCCFLVSIFLILADQTTFAHLPDPAIWLITFSLFYCSLLSLDKEMTSSFTVPPKLSFSLYRAEHGCCYFLSPMKSNKSEFPWLWTQINCMNSK